MRQILYHIVLLLFAASARAALPPIPVTPAAQPVMLQCEQLTDPQGIDIRHPRLSWQLSAKGSNIQQSAWQILVASTPELLAMDKGDCWSSPKTPGDQSRMIAYAGKPLKTGHSYYWKVKVWTTTTGATTGPTSQAATDGSTQTSTG